MSLTFAGAGRPAVRGAGLRDRARTGLVLAAVLLGLLISGTALWVGHETRRRSEVNARRELQNLALTLAEQSEQAVRSLQLVQNGVVEQFQSLNLTSPAGFEAAARGFTMHRVLADRITGLPQINGLTLVGSTGKVINFSRFWPIPDLDLADRDYFRALSADASLTSFIGMPVRNRGDGRWSVFFAHSLRSADGTLLGVVAAALDLGYFERFYEAVSLGPDSAVSLMRRDAVMLARFPPADHAVPQAAFRRTPLFQELLAHAEAGTIRQVSAVDGTDRLVAARALKAYPFVVNVSTRMDRVLGPWREDMLLLGAGVLLLQGMITVAVVLGLRQLRASARAAGMARQDVLTGLANRLALREAMEAAAATGEPFALALIDLDNFKAVNDVLGHAAGDGLLQTVGGVLGRVLGPAEHPARLGGDEFAVLQRAGDADDLCRRLSESLRLTVDLNGRSVAVSASIGVARLPRDAGSPDELMRRADVALYAAKAAGRDGWRGFDKAMERALLERQDLEAGLPFAIERDELAVHLQPIIDLRLGAPSGFEALLHWQHPTRGLIAPGTFIPVAEEAGLMVPLCDWMLRRACAAAVAWTRPLTLAVNLSAARFAAGDLAAAIGCVLAETGLPPARLEIEVSEAVLQRGDRVLATLRALRALGVRVALDDFGTGYSSLSTLASFPFDRIKVGRCFVRDMLSEQTSATMVRATIALSRSLGLSTTAEGVDTAEQLAALREAGPTEVQGVLFSPPLPAGEAAARYGLAAPGPAALRPVQARAA